MVTATAPSERFGDVVYVDALLRTGARVPLRRALEGSGG